MNMAFSFALRGLSGSIFSTVQTSARCFHLPKATLSFRTKSQWWNHSLAVLNMACTGSRGFCISMPKYSKKQELSNYDVCDSVLFEKVDQRHIKKPSLIIFDKDGTLICLHKMWGWWIEPFADRLSTSLGFSISKQLFTAMKYDAISKTVSNHSVLAQATNANVRRALVGVIMETGVSEEEASDVLENAWEHEVVAKHPPLTECIEPVGDVKKLFDRLKLEGIKIAICTSDCRDITVETLKMLGCYDSVDLIICGDDEINVQKPAPDNAINICQALNVHPSETFVLGDTTADVIMGRRAKLGLVVGVLTGAGQEEDLEPYSDLVIDSIHSILPLISKSKIVEA